VRGCRKRIDADAAPNEHENWLAVTQFLARLRYNDSALFEILGGRQAMIESPQLQELKDEWTREATRSTTIKDLMAFLVGRFGPKAEAIEADLKSIEDVVRLNELVGLAATCRTLTSFRKQLDR
jgi:hypothetical protein